MENERNVGNAYDFILFGIRSVEEYTTGKDSGLEQKKRLNLPMDEISNFVQNLTTFAAKAIIELAEVRGQEPIVLLNRLNDEIRAATVLGDLDDEAK